MATGVPVKTEGCQEVPPKSCRAEPDDRGLYTKDLQYRIGVVAFGTARTPGGLNKVMISTMSAARVRSVFGAKVNDSGMTITGLVMSAPNRNYWSLVPEEKVIERLQEVPEFRDITRAFTDAEIRQARIVWREEIITQSREAWRECQAIYRNATKVERPYRLAELSWDRPYGNPYGWMGASERGSKDVNVDGQIVGRIPSSNIAGPSTRSIRGNKNSPGGNGSGVAPKGPPSSGNGSRSASGKGSTKTTNG